MCPPPWIYERTYIEQVPSPCAAFTADILGIIEEYVFTFDALLQHDAQEPIYIFPPEFVHMECKRVGTAYVVNASYPSSVKVPAERMFLNVDINDVSDKEKTRCIMVGPSFYLKGVQQQITKTPARVQIKWTFPDIPSTQVLNASSFQYQQYRDPFYVTLWPKAIALSHKRESND
jgi:hypothetical protein